MLGLKSNTRTVAIEQYNNEAFSFGNHWFGVFIHLDDAFQRLCGLTLSENTPPRMLYFYILCSKGL